MGNDHHSLASFIGNLGDIYKEQGKLKEAQELYNKAIELTKKAYGNSHPSLIDDIGNLGNVYME